MFFLPRREYPPQAANPFPRKLVLEACDATAAYVLKAREDEREYLITEKMKEKLFIWWGRNPTREEAIKSLQTGDRYDDWWMADFTEDGRAAIAKSIRRMAERSNETDIWLTRDEVGWLIWPGTTEGTETEKLCI